MSNYQIYKENTIESLTDCLSTMGCQPILFVGSGFSRHYFNSYNWDELLRVLARMNPLAKDYTFYSQICENKIEIGSKLSEVYMNYAWGEGNVEFKEKYGEGIFSEKYNKDIYIKSKTAELIRNRTPKRLDELNKSFRNEIDLLKEIRPHAIITTNYDNFIELIFDDYTPVIGEKIITNNYANIGEIYKIHGCISEASSLVLTKQDYDDFMSKKKYLSAKLLTFFLEHPIIFLGYSASDPNIQAILSDIDEILSSNNELVNNIFLVDWREKVDENQKYSSETLIRLDNQRALRINYIVCDNYEWIFRALINENAIDNVNPRLLRALLARTYQLVRTDIPKRKLEIDYCALEAGLSNDKNIGKIFGITSVVDPSQVNIEYPYTLSEIGKMLGYKNWYYANELMNAIREDNGYDIKASDNKYHIKIKTGGSAMRKYSYALYELLQKKKNGTDYKIE